jgi:hypothetical protein
MWIIHWVYGISTQGYILSFMVSASDRGSKAAKCLEGAWRILRRLHPCLPPVVIVILATGGRKKLGHFADCVWRTPENDGGNEDVISPALFDCPEDLLETLVHEAAHALLFEMGLNAGCGGDGYYHREEFQHACRKLGLECVFNNRRYGWSRTVWPASGVPAKYRAVLKLLREDLPWGLLHQKTIRPKN